MRDGGKALDSGEDFNMNENREHQKDAMPGLASLSGIE